MKITLTDKEVRDAIERYVRLTHQPESLLEPINSFDVTVLSITRHHGGTVSAEVKVDTK